MKDKEKPQFSRNLEISVPSGDKGRSRGVSSGESAESMSPEEKQMYFRVEGRKILEMLAAELERPEPDPVSIVLISDLHRSWRALWRGDDSFPVGPFSEMFELAFSVLSSIAVIGRKTRLEERMMLDDLKEYMTRLVSGNPGVGYLDACRRLIEKASPVAGKLKQESMALTGKAFERQESESVQTRERRRAAPRPEGRSDISSSVDEWFDQVTRLMVQPLDRKKEDPSEEKTAKLSGGEYVLPVSRPAEPIGKSPAADQIVLFPGEKTAGHEKEKTASLRESQPRLSAPDGETIPAEKRKAVPPRAGGEPGAVNKAPEVTKIVSPAVNETSVKDSGTGTEATSGERVRSNVSGQADALHSSP